MNSSNVLSVNPSQKTLGALNPEVTAAFLSKQAAAVTRKTMSITTPRNGLKSFLDLFSGSANATQSSWSAKSLFMRLLAGLFFITTGYFALSAGGTTIPLLEIIGGTLLIAGFLARPAMAVLVGAFAFEIASGSSFDTTFLAEGVIALIACILGTGKYSFDSIIRLQVYKAIKGRAIKNRKGRNLDYKAFRNF